MLKKHVKYTHGKPIKKNGWRIFTSVLSLILIGSGVYLFVLLRAPNIRPLSPAKQEAFIPEQYGDKQVIIPKIAVNIPVNEGDYTVLDKGGWHRLPNLGDPESGGNFIVSAHRYILASTPDHTKQQSYFYNLDKLVVGDQILADWHHKRYTYKVTAIETVPPTQLSIESASDEKMMTLYTCTLKGSRDGRVVVIAKPAS